MMKWDLGVKEAVEALEAVLLEQSEHAVWERVRVNWEASESLERLCVLLGPLEAPTVQWMSVREVMEAVQGREERIALSVKDPLRHCWEHDMWRRIDLEMARKRLAHPGKVLELLITGGKRPGKTEGATRRTVAAFLYTRESWAWGLHETDITSRGIQQKRVERFLPPELRPDSGKLKKDKHTKFTYTAGTGFTGSGFHVTWECQDEAGRTFTGGGAFDFRFYKQDEASFQGSELVVATSDELVPLNLAKIVADRLTTRAADTARPEFLARIRHAMELLERGESLPVALLGAIYHSVHLISFTPAEGWTATVSHFLNDAVKYDFEVSPDLVNKAGVRDPRVPRFAQPADPQKLVAYLFTSDNRIKPAYPALRDKYLNASEREVRISLHGDVDKDWQTRFHGFDAKRHVKRWADVPCEGTVYEVIDPAGAKPWVICHFLVDVAGRHWQLQEWPCPKIPIEGAEPGAWAVVSESEKRNGDAGPAQKLRLNWTRADWVRLIWQLRARLAMKLKETRRHGDTETRREVRVRMEKRGMEWKEKPTWSMPDSSEFVIPEATLMDSRYAQVRTEVKGVSRTLLEAMMEEENGVPMEPAPGDPIHEGDLFIQQALAADILGLPGLMILEECENTRFMFSTYNVPEFKEDTKASDEACKDFRDPWAYYLLSGPEHVGWDRPRMARVAGGVLAREEEWV